MKLQSILLVKQTSYIISAIITFVIIILCTKFDLKITSDGGSFLTYFTFTSGFIFTAYIAVCESKAMSILKNDDSISYHAIISIYKESLLLNLIGILICSIQILFCTELIYLFIFILGASFLKIIGLIMDTIDLLKLGIR